MDLNFVHGDRYGFNFIYLCENIQLSKRHLLKMLSFLQHTFSCIFVKHQMSVIMTTHAWVFYFIPLVYMSVFVTQYFYFGAVFSFTVLGGVAYLQTRGL